jgi:hypothetical protein
VGDERAPLEMAGAAEPPPAAQEPVAPQRPAAVTESLRQTRNATATTFLGFLVGLALAEAVAAVRDAFAGEGPTTRTVGLFAIVVVACLSTFLFGSYNLIFTPYTGMVYLANFGFLVAEALLLIFVAGEGSVARSRASEVGFFGYLVPYYAVDVAWNVLTAGWYWTRPDLRRYRRAAAIGAFLAAGVLVAVLAVLGAVGDDLQATAIVLVALLAFASFLYQAWALRSYL